ncbi:unnamed protein product [Bursaphelenchus xylophilus]|uniref:(pine wood nematode) hypothetical protein n=1 Tax=Bursaphelenchus xylophilus TaxID=6326 RepID=A0A1I7RPK5_BURXY|nr:unnamed protein product [Bursaphelenchus xylophilus]CAG9096179.1 unnamed protein product [Bursaphelenchus xylophilus]
MSNKVEGRAVRLPVEKWSRPELEDRFHTTYARNLELGQRNVALEKELKVLNGRLRKSVMNKENIIDENVRELERKNKFLNEKLHSLKHQLLAYTKPSAQSATVNSLTSRVSQRPRTAQTGHLTEKNHQDRDPEERNVISRPQTTGQIEINNNDERSVLLQGIGEKTVIIKLNKELREERERLEVARYDVENKSKQIEKLKNINQSLNNELEQSRRSVRALEQSTSRLKSEVQKSSESSQTSTQVVRQELKQLKDELESLKQANKQLIESSLRSNVGLVDGNINELKAQIDQLTSVIQRLENEKSQMKRNYGNLERDYKELYKQSKKFEFKQQESRPKARPQPEREVRGRKEKDNVLDRLYDDITNMVDSHLTGTGSDSSYERNTKWQQMYNEMYNELEKTRRMVASEYEINKELGVENQKLNGENETLKQEHQRELDSMRETITNLKRQIEVLENQLRAVAGGDFFTYKVSEKISSLNQPEMKFDINKIKVFNENLSDLLSPKAPRFFICVEFFDFEIATTQIFNGLDSGVAFSTSYELVVSDLLIHYLSTDGINLELYETSGTSYQKIAESRISLKDLLGPKKQHKIKGIVEFVDKKNKIIANLDYSINVPEDLLQALKQQNRRMLANSMIPADETDVDDINRLIVHVHRAQNLDSAFGTDTPSTYIAYQIFDFPPQSTKILSSNPNPEYNHTQTFNLPNSEGVHSYLKESTMTFYVVQDPSATNKAGYNGLLKADLRLFPLARNTKINKSLKLLLSNGEPTESTIEVSVYWEFDYKYKEIPESIAESASMIIKEIDEPQEPARLRPKPDLPQAKPRTLADKPPEVSQARGLAREIPEAAPREGLPAPSQGPPRPVSRELPPQKPVEPQRVSSPPSSSPSSDEGLVVNLDRPLKYDSNKKDTDSEVIVLESPKTEVPIPAKRFEGVDPVALNRRLSLELMKEKDSEVSDSEESVESTATFTAEERRPSIKELEEEIEVEDEEKNEDEEESNGEEDKKGPRIVEFTEPLHLSIPPSDTSSFAESSARSADGKPLRKHLQKNQPNLSLASGHSSLRVVSETERISHPDEIPEGASVELIVQSLRVDEKSPLLNQEYDHTMIFIEWNFLDFDREDCQTANSIEIPRNSKQTADFNSAHTYELDWKRIALLKQWMDLSIRMKFVMVLENNDQEEVEDLGEGFLDLDEVIGNKNQVLTFYDVDMLPLATLDLEINYTEVLLRHFDELDGNNN